jgi:hypothetical protein
MQSLFRNRASPSGKRVFGDQPRRGKLVTSRHPEGAFPRSFARQLRNPQCAIKCATFSHFVYRWHFFFAKPFYDENIFSRVPVTPFLEAG